MQGSVWHWHTPSEVRRLPSHLETHHVHIVSPADNMIRSSNYSCMYTFLLEQSWPSGPANVSTVFKRCNEDKEAQVYYSASISLSVCRLVSCTLEASFRRISHYSTSPAVSLYCSRSLILTSPLLLAVSWSPQFSQFDSLCRSALSCCAASRFLLKPQNVFAVRKKKHMSTVDTNAAFCKLIGWLRKGSVSG